MKVTSSMVLERAKENSNLQMVKYTVAPGKQARNMDKELKSLKMDIQQRKCGIMEKELWCSPILMIMKQIELL